MQRRRGHAERTQDVLRDVLVVGLSGHARDDAAEYGKPVVRVLVGDAGSIRERNAAAKHAGQLGLGFGELLIAPGVVFGETLGVRQQVPDRDPRRVGRRVAEGLQLRNVSLGRIVERQLARITELENRHRREALGHRRDAKDRVDVDRRLGLDVAHAHRALVRELAIDHDAPRRAGRMNRRRVVAEDFVDVRKRRRQLRPTVGFGKLRGRGGSPLSKSGRASDGDNGKNDP